MRHRAERLVQLQPPAHHSRLSPSNVLQAQGEANLTKPGVVNVTQMATVDKSELVEQIGRLPAAKIAAIRSGLHLLIDGLS